MTYTTGSNNVLCQLPHQAWPVLAEAIRSEDSHSNSKMTRIRLNKKTVDALNVWSVSNWNINIFSGQREIIVPTSWFVPNINMMRMDQGGKQSMSDSTCTGNFPDRHCSFEYLRYKLEIIRNVEYGDYVWYTVDKAETVTNAKLLFTGTRESYNTFNDLYAIVDTGQRDKNGKELLHKLYATNVYLLSDVIKMNNATKGTKVKAARHNGTILLSSSHPDDAEQAKGPEVGESPAITDKEVTSIKAFGNCFAHFYGCKGAPLHGIDKKEVMFNVMAKLPGENVLGRIEMACVLFGAVQETTPYVGIQFEASVTEQDSPISIKHVTDYCIDASNCMKGCLAFIPLPLILNEDSSNIFATVDLNKETKNSLLEIHSTGIECNIPSPDIEKFKPRMAIMGMEWKNNSCYMDSILFGMFAFTDKFDYCLKPKVEQQQGDKGDSVVDPKLLGNQRICDLLKFHIVAPLRRGFCVSSDAITELRGILAEHYNPLFKERYMDSEEFALTLFGSVLDVPEFLHYDSGGEDHIYQIFAYPKEGSDKDPVIPHLEALIEQSFLDSSVKLTKVPEPAFIVKLPVSNGEPIFSRLRINPRISLKNIVQLNQSEGDDGGQGAFLFSLRAIVCLEKDHFTCFAKLGTGESSEWVFHNSVETPKCVHVEGLGKGLESLMNLKEGEELPEYPKAALEWILKIMSTAYLCIYEKDN